MHQTENGKSNSDVYCFVDEFIDSFVSWDILLYFHSHADAIETTASLASRLGRNESDVQAEIDNMLDKGVLSPASGGTVRHDPTPELAGRIKDFNDALAVASTRMEILTQVLGKRKSAQ